MANVKLARSTMATPQRVVFESEYDGCGKCLLGVRRLSRVSDSTNSPERQENQIRAAVRDYGGHIIAWADDWEVSGAVNPMERPELGPWLRGENGQYAGIAGADVERIGRDVLDALMTARLLKTEGKTLLTYDHHGPWNFSDSNDEAMFTFKVLGAQMELRNIQKRNRDETHRARDVGKPANGNFYGYQYVRLVPTGSIDHVEVDPEAAAVLRQVASRILACTDGTITPSTECARLNRAGVLSPRDYRAVRYGRQPEGHPWRPKTLIGMLRSQSALGYLTHQGRPVLGRDGEPIRLAAGLWDMATHKALVAKTEPTARGHETWGKNRAPKGTRLLSGVALCGNCGNRLYVSQRTEGELQYICNARVRGIPGAAQQCKPAPGIALAKLDQAVTDWFLDQYGHVPLFSREYDAGSEHNARLDELDATLERLTSDRQAGLYDTAAQTQWYRREHARITREAEALRALPHRPAGMHWVLTGQTVADQWAAAVDDAARRELLATYEVKVTLFPRQVRDRIHVHGLDAATESEARREAAERSAHERAAYLDALETARAFRTELDQVADYTDANAEDYRNEA